MIRCVLDLADGGKVICVGVVDANVRKLQAGQPMLVPLGQMLVEAFRHDAERMADMPPQLLQLTVMYGETHEQILREIDAAAPGQVDDEAWTTARKLDEQMRSEGLMT